MRPLQGEHVASAAAYADKWLGYQQRTRQIPGLTAIVRHDGVPLVQSAHGLADLERGTAMSPETMFRVASNSKMLTSTMVAQLVEQGRLRYDDRLGDHLPWLPAASGMRAVTLRELLGHASGVFRDGRSADFWQLDGEFPDHGVLRGWLSEDPQVLPANDRFKYSNVGYALLGQVVEHVTRMSYAHLLSVAIARPLDLADTGADLDEHAAARLATGYTSSRDGMSRLPLPHASTGAYAPATGCYSTADELSRFADAHCLGVPGLLSDESKRAMHQPHWEVEGEPQRYGLGFQCFDVGGRRLVGHGGAFPGFITATRLDPAERLVVVVLTNAIDAPAAELACGVVLLVNMAHEVADSLDVVDASADRFVGRFYSMWGVTDVVRLGSRLVAVDLDRLDPTDHLTVLRPVSEDELEIVSTSGMRYPGERVRYSFEADGSVSSVRFGAQTLLPVEGFRATPYAGRPER
ncbi:MAG TPA: serine hydrolase domain-containing protein [Mycobacteriales bacterium]|nr:serine hydrolase domain-containing protein [Mycobacteriales bacterium]